jgi:hypothetical protein|tara:strand:+ start:406 stop:603 length:198 start_codon:yes stop_codon:yes gene_type:complete
MKSVVKIVTNKPSTAPKATEYAQIDDQGRIPYGKTAEAKIPSKMSRKTARGMGAAIKGGSYLACE